MARFPIAYSTPMRLLLGLLGLGASRAWVDVGDASVEVRMGWGFRAGFPRSSVHAVERSTGRVISQGIHGRDGRWLVNGTTRGVVRIGLASDQEARVLGRRVRLSTLEVSVEDPDGLLIALSTAT